LDEIKDAPCADCGGRFPPYVMDFDHKDWSTKTATISMMRHSTLERIKEEIAKCELVCSNCHRIRTHKQRSDPAFRARLGRRRK
jgi:hypothetical protein